MSIHRVTRWLVVAFLIVGVPATGAARERSDQVALRRALKARGLDPKAIVLPHAVNEAMTDWLEETMPRRLADDVEARILLERLLSRDELDLDYLRGYTGTAVEVFETGEANCLAFTHLFIGLARELGLPVFYVKVEDLQSFEREGDLVVISGHVTAGFGSKNRPQILEFSIAPVVEYRQVRPLADVSALALFYSNRGAELLIEGDLAAALEWLETAVRIDPELPEGWLNLGVTYRRSGRLEAAERSYWEAVGTDPEFAPAYQNLSALLLRAPGRAEEGRRLLALSDQKENRNPFNYLALGDLSLAQGRPDDAERYGSQPARQLTGTEMVEPPMSNRAGSVEPQLGAWELWVDTGGTFTDCLARDPDGRTRRLKVLSSGALRGVIESSGQGREVRVAQPYDLPDGFLDGAEMVLLERPVRVRIERSMATGTLVLERPIDVLPGQRCELRTGEEAPVLAARLATATAAQARLPEMVMRLATTRATNALLERSGAPTALFITRGFADLLEIGTQQRPDLFALEIRKRRPFYTTVVEVDERLQADGRLLTPLDEAALAKAAAHCVDSGLDSAAVALLHSYRNNDHEQRARRILEAAGFRHVSCSAELAPFIRLLPRAETAVVDAYLSAVIETYLEAVSEVVGGGRLQVMTSAGGLQAVGGFRPKESLLSGPAGGVVGAARAGALSGREQIISFDMGGTSTDVARHDGDFEYQFETVVGEARILAPALAIETVAAGGGSICRFDGRQLKVGPQSARAEPGPACYGAGGPLTLTDINLLLGRLDVDHFEIPLAPRAAEAALVKLLGELGDSGMTLDRDELLRGLLAIANERMAEAIRRISVRQGYDPADYTLVAFGGAGAQHAVALAGQLGVTSVLVPRDASLLSAWGLGHALVERFVERQVLEPTDLYQGRVAAVLQELGDAACEKVVAEGVPASEVEVRRRLLALRLVGQQSTVDVEYDGSRSLVELFGAAYVERFGYPPPDRSVEVESVRVVASSQPLDCPAVRTVEWSPVTTPDTRRCLIGDAWQATPLYEREALAAGAELVGPALVAERFSATVIEAGWRCRVDVAGALVIEREGA